MKSYLFLIVGFLLHVPGFSQAHKATVSYEKTPQEAVEVDIPYPEKTVVKAITDQLEKKGYKGKDTKGFLTFKGVRLPELGTDAYDLYFKTERKSRKEKDVTTISLLISSGYEKFLDGTSTVLTNARQYLDSSLVMVADYDLEMQVTEQETVFKKSNDKMADLAEEAEELQSKRKKLDREIEENQKSQEEHKKQVEKQGNILTMLKGKRRQ
ncbi:MAG: hypothetical protein Q7T76_01045 [Ferruginibacter sp.]|nr:hypothetical protein [Ferruginibacter sp.]